MELFVDGRRIPDTDLARTVDSVTRELDRLHVGPGCGVEVDSDDAVTIAAATIATRRLGAVLVPDPYPAGQSGATRRRSLTVARICGPANASSGELAAVVPTSDPSLAERFPADAGHCKWTGGSTGGPKLVLKPGSMMPYSIQAHRDRLGYDRGERLVFPLSLRSGVGLPIVPLAAATGLRLYVESRFSASRIIARIRDESATCLDAVPSMYHALLRAVKHDSHAASALRSLRVRRCTGSILPIRFQEDFRDVVGAGIVDWYGTSETGAIASNSPSAVRLGTVGRPIECNDVRIDAETGEILVRGPMCMMGYFGDAAATSNAMTEDGYVRTGDIGEFDADGFLRIVGRSKEILKIHGKMYSPEVLEERLETHPGVDGAAVVGISSEDDERGDSVIVFIVARQPRAGDGVAVAREACREYLPLGRRPRKTIMLKTLPYLASGKLDRPTLRAMAMAEISEPGASSDSEDLAKYIARALTKRQL